MAQRTVLDIPSSTPTQPSPMDLAREAAQYEAEQLENQEPVTAPKPQPSKATKSVSVKVAFEVPDTQAEQRRNATFSISYKMHEQLDEAAAKYKTSRSAILERIFFAWWEQVKDQ